jgi:uncharacterized protein YneR
MTNEEIYLERIANLENRLRESINANHKAHKSEIQQAQYDLALMYARLIEDVDKSKHSVAAIESLLNYSKQLLKDKINFFKEEDGNWYFINAHGEKVRINP